MADLPPPPPPPSYPFELEEQARLEAAAAAASQQGTNSTRPTSSSMDQPPRPPSSEDELSVADLPPPPPPPPPPPAEDDQPHPPPPSHESPVSVTSPSPSASPAPTTPNVVRSSSASSNANNTTPPSHGASPTTELQTETISGLSIPVTRGASGSIISVNAPAAPTTLPSGSFAPVVRRPVSIKAPALNQGSGTYQSLSASFGDETTSTSSLGSGKYVAAMKKELAGPGASSSSSTASVQQPRLNRSGSIDRLTGRVPLPVSNASPIKVGWLKKEGEGVLGGHKKRWCVLGTKVLDFFKEITDEKPQGTIILPGASIFVEDKCEFHILPVRGAAKKISFKCDSEFDRNAWVKILTELSAVSESLLEKVFDADSYTDWSTSDISNILLPALTRLLSKVGTMSSIWGVGDNSNVGVLLSGCLTKMGDKVKNFKRRYFVLVGSILLYFENEESYMLTDAGAPAPNSAPTPTAEKVQPVLGSGAPSAPSITTKGVDLHGSASATAASGKGNHGKEVLASLTRTHMRAQRRSITPVDLQNHHIIRRTSHQVSLGHLAAHSGLASGSIEEEKRKRDLQKKALKGEGRPALGMIPLTDCSLALEPGHARAYGFSIQTRDRKYFLFADNEDELRAWFYMLNLVTHSLPIQRYMKNMLEQEIQQEAIAKAASSTGGSVPIEQPSLLSDADLTLLKKQLTVTLLDPTCVRFLQNYWLERQSFHEPRTYPFLFPLESPLTLLTEKGTKFFDGLLVDEAGERGENAIHLPLHYLHFWLDCENWMNLRAPSRLDPNEELNPYATAQDPSCIEVCIPEATTYRQQRAEEIIDKYLSHGAPYPVYLEHSILDEIFSSCLRGPNAPNKIAPSQTLFQKAQELVTELLTVEVFPRYLKSKSSCWSYLTSVAAKYDETLIYNRAENMVDLLLARAYEPEVYEELTEEEKEEEENERINKFQNLVSKSPEDVDAIALECAEQFGLLPNTDPTKLIYHNYLYALQRLREYHSLFTQPASATPSPIDITFRQTHAANAFYHDFLISGSIYAICVPYKLVRNLRTLLSVPSPRRQFLFMDIEHCILTELQFGLGEAKMKVRRQVENQKGPLKKASVNPSTGLAERRSVSARSSVASRASIAVSGGGLGGALPSVSEDSSQLVVSQVDDVPFHMVFGVSSLFSHFRRFSLTCRHINPQYLWNQIALASKIFDYRHLSDPKVMVAYARQVYSQYLSENAPNKINLTKSTTDQFKVGINQQSPGPHVFLPVLREVYKNLEHLFNNTYKTVESNAINYSYLQEDFGLFMRNEICVTQGKRDFNFDANLSLMSNNKNAATWFDILEYTINAGAKELDESLVNLSSHQAVWCAYFKQFLTERFCAENASFYVEADDYRRCVGPSYRILKAKRLYEKYISETAQLQVNVPSWVARELTAILHKYLGPSAPATGPPSLTRPASARPSATSGTSEMSASSPLLYIAAQREIFLMVLNDCMKPFLESQPFKNYKAICQAKVQ